MDEIWLESMGEFVFHRLLPLPLEQRGEESCVILVSSLKSREGGPGSEGKKLTDAR